MTGYDGIVICCWMQILTTEVWQNRWTRGQRRVTSTIWTRALSIGTYKNLRGREIRALSSMLHFGVTTVAPPHILTTTALHTSVDGRALRPLLPADDSCQAEQT